MIGKSLPNKLWWLPIGHKQHFNLKDAKMQKKVKKVHPSYMVTLLRNKLISYGMEALFWHKNPGNEFSTSISWPFPVSFYQVLSHSILWGIVADPFTQTCPHLYGFWFWKPKDLTIVLHEIAVSSKLPYAVKGKWLGSLISTQVTKL